VAGSTSIACLGATAAWVHYKLDFQTDFSESNAALLWQSLDRGRLFIERYAGKSSGVPAGAHLFAPSAAMANSEAFLLASVDERPAEFILRGHTQQDCYRLRLTRRTAGSAQAMLAVEVLKRRNGRDTRLWPGEEQTGPIVFPHALATIQVEMDADRFSVWLRKPYAGTVAGIPRFDGFDRRLLAHWTDGEFRDGLLGLWGPEHRAPSGRQDFRVFAVGLRA
jgi:hypothetical protein